MAHENEISVKPSLGRRVGEGVKDGVVGAVVGGLTGGLLSETASFLLPDVGSGLSQTATELRETLKDNMSSSAITQIQENANHVVQSSNDSLSKAWDSIKEGTKFFAENAKLAEGNVSTQSALDAVTYVAHKEPIDELAKETAKNLANSALTFFDGLSDTTKIAGEHIAGVNDLTNITTADVALKDAAVRDTLDILKDSSTMMKFGAAAGATYEGMKGLTSNQDERVLKVQNETQEKEIQALAGLAGAALSEARESKAAIGKFTQLVMKQREQLAHSKAQGDSLSLGA